MTGAGFTESVEVAPVGGGVMTAPWLWWLIVTGFAASEKPAFPWAEDTMVSAGPWRVDCISVYLSARY